MTYIKEKMKIEDLFETFYTVEREDKVSNVILPLKINKDYVKGQKGGAFYGIKSNLTIDNFFDLTYDKTTIAYNSGKKKYEKINRDISLKNAEAYELRNLLSPYNIIIIDIDGIDKNNDISIDNFFEDKRIPDLFRKNNMPYTLSRTKRLPHFFFIIEGLPNIKNINQNFRECFNDIKADLLFNHAWELKDAELYNFTDSLPVIEWKDIRCLLSPDYLKKIEETKIIVDDITETTKNLYEDIDETQSVISDITIDFGTITNPNKNTIDLEKFKTYVNGLSIKRSDLYDDWTKIVWGIYNVAQHNKWGTKTTHELIHNFSKISKVYDEEKVYNFIQNHIREDKNGVGVGTIIKYYNEDNPEINDNFEIDYTERGMGELYYKYNKKDFIFQDENVYIYYNNEWHNDKGRYISKNCIYIYLEDYLKKKINIITKNETEKNKKELTEINNIMKKIKSINFIERVVEQIITMYMSETNVKNIIFDLGIDQKYNINFKNGIYDIKKKIFRKRTKEDYVSLILDYDYIEKEKIKKEIHDFVLNFFSKIQPNEEQRKFTLGFLAYCITGNTGKQIFKTNIGYEASNGKSTEIKIHELAFPIYTMKFNIDTFNKNNTKRHKHIQRCLREPIRLGYIEEIDKDLLDATFIKDFVDGTKLSNEILFGTCEEKSIQAKIITFSNTDMNIKSDKGILRRGRLQYYESKFIDKIENDDTINHIYKKINNFEEVFNDILYKNAYFHLLLEHIDKLEIPESAEENFKTIMEENNELKAEIDENFIITKNKVDIISKYEIIDIMQHEYKWCDILSFLKTQGIKFEYTHRFPNDGSYKSKKGVLYGIKKI